MPNLLAVDHDAVGRAEVDDIDLEGGVAAGDPNLGMTAGDTWVVDPQVGVAAAADDQAGRLQRVPGAVDLQHQRGPPDRGVAGRAVALGDAGHRLGAHGEAAGREAAVQREVDLDRAVEDVAHLPGVLAQLGAHLGVERLGVRRELVVVGLGEVHGELVGHQPLVPGHQLGLGVQLAHQPRGDLHRLHIALERPGEDGADRPLDLLLESLENAHVPPLSDLATSIVSVRRGRPERCAAGSAPLGGFGRSC